MVRLFVYLVCGLSIGSSSLRAEISRSLYVSMGLDDGISRVDLRDHTVYPNIIPVDDMPNQIMIKGDTAYVVCSGDDDICVIDLGQEEVISRIYCISGSNPWYMVIYQDSLIYVSNFNLHSVSKISLATGALLDEIAVGMSPEGMFLLNDKLYVANTGWDDTLYIYHPGSVSVVDLTGDTVMATIPTSLNPQYLDIDPQGEVNVVCTGDWGSTFGWVYVIDPQTDTPVDSMYTGGSPGHIRVGKSGIGHLAAGGWWTEGYIYTVNTLTEEVLHGSDNPIITDPGVMEVLEDNWGWIYCSNQLVGVDRVTMFKNDYTPRRIFQFPDASGPQCLAVYEAGDWVEVTAGPDTLGVPGDSLIVGFLTTNLAGMQVNYAITVTDSLGWEIFPSNLSLALEVDQDTLIDVKVTIPQNASAGEVNRVRLAAVSQSNPEMDNSDFLTITVTQTLPEFIRGDVDGNALLSIGDGLRCFRCQFVPGWQDSCQCHDAVDANDNGAITIGDCIRILRKQFVPGWQDSIPLPFPDCGPDPNPDGLGCESHSCMTGHAMMKETESVK